MKVANKLILAAGALVAVDAAKLQVKSQAQLSAEEGMTVQTENGVEALSQSFLEAEAQSEMKMIAQQEERLVEENQMREHEKVRFLNIVSEKERYSLAQDKFESDKAPDALKGDVKPIVFQNIDAQTGKSAPLKDLTTLTPMEIEKVQKEKNVEMIAKTTETNQKIVENKNNTMMSTVSSINDSITAADKLINALQSKSRQDLISVAQKKAPQAPQAHNLLQSKADIKISKQPDPLEHTRYGEGNHPSTNEKPIPDVFVKPLVITNVKDEHDFTPPYKDHTPPKVFKQGMEIIAQHNKPVQKPQSLATVGPTATQRQLLSQKQTLDKIYAGKHTGPKETKPTVEAPKKPALSQKKHKGDDEKEPPFPIASSVNQGKNQAAAVTEWQRMPKVKPEEKKKALVQKKNKGDDEEKDKTPFPIASSVNQGKTQTAAVAEWQRMPKAKPAEKKSLVQKKNKGDDEEKDKTPFPIASSVNQGKTQTAAVAEWQRMPKAKPAEKKSLAQQKHKGDDEKEPPFPIASSVNQGKNQAAAVSEMMRMPKHKPEEKKKALVQTGKQPDPLEHTRYGEGNHPSTNEKPIPDVFVKPLVITNVKDEHDFTPPYKDHRPPRVFRPGMEIIAQAGKSKQKQAQIHSLQQLQKQPDPLEHTRYGEGNHPSTNEKPIPEHFVKPLVITNVKDEHDFTPPYKDHRPPKVFNPHVHLEAKKTEQKKEVAKPAEKKEPAQLSQHKATVKAKEEPQQQPAENKDKKVDIKIEKPVEQKKGAPVELKVVQDFHKTQNQEHKIKQLSIGQQISNFFGSLFHLW